MKWENSLDDLVDVRLKASSMAKYDPLRLPKSDFSDCCRPPLPLKEKRHPHTKEDLAIRIIHPGKLRHRSPRFANLTQLDVDDRVGKDQRARRLMEEN
jgi:hypothetical protein